MNRQQELERIAGQAWDPSYYTPDGSIRIEISGVAPAAASLPGDRSATGMPDDSPLRMVGQSADGGLIWNTGAVSYPVTSPEIEVRTLSKPSSQSLGSKIELPFSYFRRFGQGLLGAVEGVTIEPLRQLGDLGKAGASVVYNELLRKEGDPYWFPALNSNMAAAHTNGSSQTKLLLASVPLLNVGVGSYDATNALAEGRYGDAAEIAGGIAGGFAIGKGVSRYGDYGLTVSDIGASGIRASQAGSVGLKLVTPTATADGPFSPLVEGGGLTAHETAGGHLLIKHVGQTDAALMTRLATEPRIPAASTFPNRYEAESGVTAVLDARAAQVSAWTSSGARGQLVLNAPFDGGSVLQRGISLPTTGTNVTVVIRGIGEGNWRIVTGYPNP